MKQREKVELLKAAQAAIENPLIDDYTLKGAKGLLVNISQVEKTLNFLKLMKQ